MFFLDDGMISSLLMVHIGAAFALVPFEEDFVTCILSMEADVSCANDVLL